jgi:sucrose phosphorylase
MRDLLDMIAPGVILLTETNVPHEENISYFGDGDEARMVYNFSLPPLLLHALRNDSSRYLTAWARTVCETPDGCTWFNFTASHDGIGVRPLTGLVPDEEVLALAEQMKELGGHVSTKRNSDGSDSPYELNITYFDAMGGDGHQVERFLCSQTVMIGLKGVPATYFHSLTATPNDVEGVKETGRARSINRKKWNSQELESLLKGKTTTARVFNEYRRRLKLRGGHAAFHPDSHQRVLDLGDELFGFVRTAENGESITCIHSVSKVRNDIKLDAKTPELDNPLPCTDLLSNSRHNGAGKVITLEPYQSVWLTQG